MGTQMSLQKISPPARMAATQASDKLVFITEAGGCSSNQTCRIQQREDCILFNGAKPRSLLCLPAPRGKGLAYLPKANVLKPLSPLINRLGRDGLNNLSGF